MSCYYFSPKSEMLRPGGRPALYILEQCLRYNAVRCFSFPAEHGVFGGLEFLEKSLGATHCAEGETNAPERAVSCGPKWKKPFTVRFSLGIG